MLQKKSVQKCEIIFRYFLIACIFLYPFIHTFLGLDLGDTGYHFYAFERLYTQTEFLSFTSYFTNVVGWAWLSIFGDLGLWGLNLLEVIVEMLMAILVYRTCSPWLGKNKTLLGILAAVLASDTYLNVFNYHQFNVLLLIIILCSEMKAITEDKIKFSIIAGIAMTTVVFSRTGSITAVVTLMIYVIWYLIQKKSYKFLLRHIGSFFGAAIVTGGCFVGLLYVTNQLDDFINNVFRLSNLASTQGSGYSMDNLLTTFVFGNLDAMASGFLFLSAFVFLLLGVNLLLKQRQHIKDRILNTFIAILVIFIALYQLYYAYNVNPVASWPQMTTGPSFLIGVMYIVACLCMLYHLYAKQGQKEIAVLAMLSIVLPLLTIAGSNTGTKHVILGFWMIAPICVYAVLSLFETEESHLFLNSITEKIGIKTRKYSMYIVLSIMIVSFCFKFLHMLYYTTNFDSVDRSTLTAYVDNENVKWIRTTQREADAVNGVLDSIEDIDNNRPLMVFGGSLLYYAMTERESFVQPWVSNSVYHNDLLLEDLQQGVEKGELPIVVYGRTNNYYGFYEYNYDDLIYSEKRNTYNGKKEILTKFLSDNQYRIEYINDYYIVLLPEDLTTSEDTDYMQYMYLQ